ncbi:MAG: hypothetical protein ABIL25_08245 [candidate division WOR-3 bacterium]
MRRDVLEALRRLGKTYYTTADLAKVTGHSAGSLRVFLARWTKAGLLKRIGTGLYGLPDVAPDLERLGNAYYFPSYLSFESALARYGVQSQMPYALTFATSRRSRRLKLADTEIEYRQLRQDLFFGYEQQDSLYVAWPEKALADLLYLVSLGRASCDIRALNLKPLDRSRFSKLIARFPERTQKLAAGSGLPVRVRS